MGMAEFIKEKFLYKEIYIYCGESAEVVTYDQAWTTNKEFLYGKISDVEFNVISLEIPDMGIIYINCDNIICFWEPGLDYHQSVRTSLTKRLVGARRKDK